MRRIGIVVVLSQVRVGGSRCLGGFLGISSRVMRLTVLVVACLSGIPAATAQDQNIQAFFGTYEGSGECCTADGASIRDMKVSIAPTNRGFNITWNTITHQADGKAKVKTYSIDFEPTQREGIFGSEMRRNKFGDRVPLDPMSGEPYVWARLFGNTLTVYALHITAEGGYEMQVYNRTRTEKGLDVEFTRFRDSEPMTVVDGSLVKVGR
jgi:hypothetical protein